MATNRPPNAGIVGTGSYVQSGYPVFVSQDSAGTMVTPYGQYVWNPNAGTNGLWIPAPVDVNGNPQVTITGNCTQQTLINVSSVAANGVSNTVGAAGTYVNMTGKYAKKISITVSIAYGAAITAAPTINLFTSPDGVAWDTDAYASFSPPFATNSTKQKTVNIDPGAAKFIGIQVQNNDGTNALGAVKVIWQEVD